MNLDENDDDEEETTAAHTDIVTMFLVDNESWDLNPTGPLYVVTISHYLLSLRGEYTHYRYIILKLYLIFSLSTFIENYPNIET